MSLRPARPKAVTEEGPGVTSSAGRKFEPPVRERIQSTGPSLGPTASSIQERLNNLSRNQTVNTAANIQQKFEETTQTAKSIQQRLEAVQANALSNSAASNTRPTTSPSSPLGGSFGSFGSAKPKAATAGGSLTLAQKGTTPAATATFGSSEAAKPPRATSQPADARLKLATTGSTSTRLGLSGDSKPSLSTTFSTEAKSTTSSILQKLSDSRSGSPPRVSEKARTDSFLTSSRYQTPSAQTKSPIVPQAITPGGGRLNTFGGPALKDVCPACGNPYAPDAIFCRKCGRKRDQAGSPAKAEEDRSMTATIATTMPLLEEYLRTRYDPIINTVKQLTDRVEKARKLVKRERIRYKWDDKENQGFYSHQGITKPPIDPAQVHVIICALDYVGTSAPLTCTADGDAMQELCRACGVTDVTILYNRQATADAAASKIKRIGSRCKSGDYLVFFYAGHGANVVDEDGDEEDGKDEAFCFVTPDGKLFGGWMTDDQFAHHITSSVADDVHVLVVSDCCHSGTICDFDSRHSQWGNIQAVSLSGCRDFQTSGDTGQGGIFTHSLLIALQEFVEEGFHGEGKHVSLKRLFQRVLDKDDTIFDSAQDITMNATKHVDLRFFSWPLVPKPGYVAPWKGRRK